MARDRGAGREEACEDAVLRQPQGRAAALAGLWERWGPDKLDARDGVRDLHNRMPVMLSPEGFEPWLAGEQPTVDQGIDAAVQVTPVSPKMNSPRYNEPDCVEGLI